MKQKKQALDCERVIKSVLEGNPSITFDDIAPLAELCRKYEKLLPVSKKKWEGAGLYMAIWAKVKGGRPFFGNPGKEALMGLEEQYGQEAVLKAWEVFAKSKDAKFGWKSFAANYRDYAPKERKKIAVPSGLEEMQRRLNES